MRKCNVCGRRFRLLAKNRYEIEKCPVVLSCLTQGIVYYNAFDCPHCGCQNIVGVVEKSNSQLADCIRRLPSVTPQPKIGKWIDDKCSVCGKGIEDLISSREWYRNEGPKFCPFCGVKMEVEE